MTTQVQTASQQLTHIALILDGNRRWAKRHGLTKFEGHQRGIDNLKKIVRAAKKRGITTISAFVFSTENWRRPKTEVNFLMRLMKQYIKDEVTALHKENIRVRFIGSRHNVSAQLSQMIDQAEKLTKANTAGTLCLCFNYGGRDEIIAAVKGVVKDGLSTSQITEEVIKQHMYSHDISDPELIVRTSGEQRLSNFLLWGSAYAELMFVPVAWPEFDETWLDKVIFEYSQRTRRYGR